MDECEVNLSDSDIFRSPPLCRACSSVRVLQLVPRLRRFNRDLKVLNTVLTDLIARAKASENKADLEDLQDRNYDKVRERSTK